MSRRQEGLSSPQPAGFSVWPARRWQVDLGVSHFADAIGSPMLATDIRRGLLTGPERLLKVLSAYQVKGDVVLTKSKKCRLCWMWSITSSSRNSRVALFSPAPVRARCAAA